MDQNPPTPEEQTGGPPPGDTSPDEAETFVLLDAPNLLTVLTALSAWRGVGSVRSLSLHYRPGSPLCFLALQIEGPSPSLRSMGMTEPVATARILKSLEQHLMQYRIYARVIDTPAMAPLLSQIRDSLSAL